MTNNFFKGLYHFRKKRCGLSPKETKLTFFQIKNTFIMRLKLKKEQYRLHFLKSESHYV